MGEKLTFTKIGGAFADRYHPVTVWAVAGGPGSFSAFVYQCRLNLDIDGTPVTYGLNNPAKLNSLGKPNLQKDLEPLESWHKGWRGVSTDTSQRVGLGNACGDPGDGTKGWKNYWAKNRKFYWAGLKALQKKYAGSKYVLDDRPELEAGYGQNQYEYFKKHKVLPAMEPVGSGYFPVVQGEGSPAKGYFISTTSVVADGDADAYDANRYLNAIKVPYAVWAHEWLKHTLGGQKVNQGDYGIAIRTKTGSNTGFLFGDSGTPNKVGESSQALHKGVGGDADPISFIVFPGSGVGKIVGKNPELGIRARVTARSAALGAVRPGSVGSDLAMFLAIGKNDAAAVDVNTMSSAQSRAYNNAYWALGGWT
jgi:hypothetical protein